MGVSLYSLYAVSVVQFLQHLDASSIDLVELLVVLTQALRLAGVASYYRGRPARGDVLLILFSLETFVVMGLIAVSLFTPDPFYGQLAGNIFSTWIAALFTVVPAYLIFASVTQMARSRSLVVVLLPLALELGLLVFIATTLQGFAGTFTFARFFDFLVASTRSEVASRAIPALPALSVILPSIAVYCSLLVYATIPTAASVIVPRVNLVLPLLGAAVSLAWVYAAILVLPNSLLSFTVPGFLLVAVVWRYARR
ncbi:MAG TPA: hypothetical protein VGS04_00735 [Nitrososphaerales archaeon]|nr:hypothetical protein [Nitrososphaerales archaeon]